MHAQLRVNWAMHEPERTRRAGRYVKSTRECRMREPRRRDVDRLLEIRTIQRIRLIEDGDGLEFSAGDETLDGELAPRNVALHLHVALAALTDFRNPPERRHELAGVVGADHAPATREP
jgi:hypothetical protein